MQTLSMLIKPASGNCQMRCRYCFYADVTDSRAVGKRGLMSLETLETLVKNALAETTRYCAFGFQGGEPTLSGLEFYKTFITLVRKHNVNNVKTSFTIQTNGLAIDGDWADFLRDNGFLTGVSVDPVKEVHDTLRVDATGKETFNRSVAAANLLAKRGAEFNIMSVVTKHIAAHPDKAYQFYKKNGFRYIQFIPCIEEFGGGTHNHSLGAREYGEFLCRVFDLWHADYIARDYYSIRAFDNYITMLAGYPPENCAMGGVCGAYALIEADGDVYPCDFYAADEYLLGNVRDNSFTEMLYGEKAREFAAPSKNADEACVKCEYGFICRGGCRRDREPLVDGKLSLNRFCEAYKTFFKHALVRMRAVAFGLGNKT